MLLSHKAEQIAHDVPCRVDNNTHGQVLPPLKDPAEDHSHGKKKKRSKGEDAGKVADQDTGKMKKGKSKSIHQGRRE